MMKVELYIHNKNTNEEAHVLLDQKSKKVIRIAIIPENNSIEGIVEVLRSEPIPDELWDIVEMMDGEGYRYEPDYDSDTRTGKMLGSHFGEDCDIIEFVQDFPDEVNICGPLSNSMLLEMGDEYHLCGTKDGILWDGDLEEFLENSGITVSKTTYEKEPECNKDSGLIINWEEHEYEVVGQVELTQGEEKRCFNIIFADYASHDMNEYFDFSTNIEY